MPLTRATQRLRALKGASVRAAEPMSRHTSFRIGGKAAMLVECDELSALTEALEILAEEDVDWRVLGKGSNLLVSDEGYAGAVVVLGKDFRHFTTEDDELKTGAAVPLARLVQEAFSKGLSGLEFAVGIPGTVGGAIVMNAGSRDEWFDSVIRSVTVLEPGRGLVGLRRSEVSWGYRSTDLRSRGIVVEASLRLEQGDPTKIRWAMERSLSRRKRTQPLSMPSAGSIFKNPVGDSAGRLIEAAGLKGMTVGGAQISETHANFIVNLGTASASDVLSVMERARETVKEAFGVELEPEIELLGEFGQP